MTNVSFFSNQSFSLFLTTTNQLINNTDLDDPTFFSSHISGYFRGSSSHKYERDTEISTFVDSDQTFKAFKTKIIFIIIMIIRNI